MKIEWFRWALVALIGLLVLRQVALWALGPWMGYLDECIWSPPCPDYPVPWYVRWIATH